MFPRSNAPVELDHYTRFSAFRSIISSGQLRLYWVRKNLSADELSSFASVHQLQGLVSPGTPYYVELSEWLFYCSLTLPGAGHEQNLWDLFGDRQRGVRLRFRVNPGAAELRPMHYGGAKPTLLVQINQKLKAKTGRIFFPHSISTIAAFYLPLGYRDEAETRLLLKKTPHLIGRGTDGGNEYCAVPINQQNPICNIDLVSVTPGKYADRTEVNNLLATSRFSGVSVL
jgi:hypothetical protein